MNLRWAHVEAVSGQEAVSVDLMMADGGYS